MPTDVANVETDKLKLYWEFFFKSETGTYEKSTWLDLFLAEFLLQLKDDVEPKELIKFCPISGIVTLVGCELLCGIHRVTSSINTHYTSTVACANLDSAVDFLIPHVEKQCAGPFTSKTSPSSAEVLQKYILGGVAWKCLVLLKALGVEGLSCCRQLSSVLIWLFGELSGNANNTSKESNPYIPQYKERQPIQLLFSNKIWTKHKFNQSPTKLNISSPSEKGSMSSRSKRIVSSKTPECYSKKKADNHSSDTCSSNDDLQILNRSVSVKVVAPDDDFEYFNSPIKSGDEHEEGSVYSGSYHSQKKVKPKSEDYMTDSHRDIINSDIIPFEFTLIITDLLQELCKAESSLSGSEGSQISVQCINFSLRNLCALQFGSSPVCSLQYNAQEVSRVKLALTELLICSLDKVLIRSDLCAKLINNGILPMLLRILEDVVYKLKNRFYTKDDQARANLNCETVDSSESENILKYVFGIAYCIIAFFYSLLMQCRSITKLKEFTEQFKLYADCRKGLLLKECIELMMRIPAVESDHALTLVKHLVESIGRLINSMKRVRSEVIHSAACPRSRHKVCRQRVAAGMHHHHDVLGNANMGVTETSPCCVSVLYGALTSLLIDEEVSAHSALRTKILRVMLTCGVCCCFSPSLLMENIVRLMLVHCGVAVQCLTVLEHTVYGDLGASVLTSKVTDQLPCTICEPTEAKNSTRPDQIYHSHVGAVQKKNLWSFLIHYNSLLQLDNHNSVLHATVSHLLRITPKCRMEMKYELLFSVIYPTFIVAKHRYIIRLEESAYFLTVSCLNIFTTLLNTVSFAEQFIQKGGLSYVLELVSMSEFSKQCCSILEIAIIVEIFKMMRGNAGDIIDVKDIGLLSSVKMLLKSLNEMTVKCLKIYRIKLTKDKFEELCDLSKESELLGRGAGASENVPFPEAIKTVIDDPLVEESVDDYVDELKNVWTFWKSCAGLCLYSPPFRQFLVGEEVFLETYSMTKVISFYLGNHNCAASETRVLIKILESLLTVQLAVSDTMPSRGKELATEIVRDAFAGAEGEGGAGGCVRALCEMLVRVATACASADHVMPPLNKAKLPPLMCSSVSSEAGWSSSEESAAEPYGSEHTDGRRSDDDGYEADVEVGKFDMTSQFKSRRPVSTVHDEDSLSSTVPGTDPSVVDCSEYAATGAVAHPELCIIVVDILTQLIQKLLEAEGDEGDTAAGAALARACCARLAAALARRAPGAGLVRRLLAGPAAALLARTCRRLRELQRSILDLVQVLASQTIDSSELGAYLQLFKAPDPPLDILLGALSRMVDSVQPNMPDFILCFPVDRYDRDNVPHSVEDQLGNLELNAGSPKSSVTEDFANKLYDQHLQSGIHVVSASRPTGAGAGAGAASCWGAHAAAAAARGAGWAPWLHGLAAALWLSRPAAAAADDDAHDSSDEWQSESTSREAKRPPPAQREAPPAAPPPAMAHVLSVGNELLMFEVWLDAATGTLSFRLSRAEAAGSRVLSEAAVAGAVPPAAWSCVAFNVRELMHKRKIYIQVTLFVNGRECETVSLAMQGVLVRKAPAAGVLVGAAGAGAAWLLAALAVYRAPLLTPYTALYITARGPSAPMLSNCQVQRLLPNFPSLLTPDVLDSNVDWDQVFEMSDANLRELQDNLLLTFSAESPTLMNLYHQTVASPTGFAGRAGAGAGGGGAAAAAIPEALRVRWRGAPLPSQYRGAPAAALALGAPDVLLFLFARVVELDGSSEEQAEALSVLLRLCRLDGRLYSKFHEDDCLAMLHTVMATDKCRVSHHLLKVFLEEACSAPLLVTCGGRFFILTRSDAVLLEPKYLVFLVRAWRELEGSQEESAEEEAAPCDPFSVWMVERGAGGGGVAGSLLLALLVLLRDDHPRRQFNLQQMARVGMLGHLLLACKERYLHGAGAGAGGAGGAGAGGAAWAALAVRGARALLAAPPQPADLALLMDFVLLMHQASDTFVTHSRSNFYFLLTPELPDTSESNILNFMTKRKTSKRGRRRSRPQEPGYVMVTLKVPPAPPAAAPDAAGEGGGPSSVDSTKEMKGLINMQIKGRADSARSLHQSSLSTSDNSDITAEEKAVTQPPSDEQLEEYVTDYDDVDKYDAGCTQVLPGAAAAWGVARGLLQLLCDAVRLAPDAYAQALRAGVRPAAAAVLANHRSAAVRAAALRAAALAAPPPPDLLYYHLANQIALYPPSRELAGACAMLVTNCDVPLEDQLDERIWSEVSEKAVARSPPLLALLAGAAREPALARPLARLAGRLVDKASLKQLWEVGAAEAVVRALRAAAEAEPEGAAPADDELRALLARLAAKALLAQHSMQYVNEIQHMLSFVARQPGAAGAAARGAHAWLLGALLRRLGEPGDYCSVGGEAEGAPRAELEARHHALAARAVDFLVARDPDLEISQDEITLVETLYSTLLIAVYGGAGAGAGGAARRWWGGAGAGWLALLQELFHWLVSPAARCGRLQAEALRRAYLAPPDLQQLLTPSDPTGQRKLAVYLLCILKSVHLEAAGGAGARLELPVTDWARAWALSTQAQLAERLHGDALPAEARELAAADLRRRRPRAAQRRHLARVVFAREALVNKLTESAMSITRQVVDLQNNERKRFMDHLRRSQSDAVASARRWQRLIAAYTHEQALWYHEPSYPRSWELDPTEGPAGVRVRLRRCHLDIDQRFLKDEFKYKAAGDRPPAPLAFLSAAGAGAGGGAGRGLVALLQHRETVGHMARVTHVTVAADRRGDLLLTDRCVHFVPEEGAGGARSWALGALARAAPRRWCLREVAVELFLHSGRAQLVAFDEPADRDAFLAALDALHLPNRIEPETLSESMNLWRNGLLTNWEYLMRLNDLGGRTYNDLMQYPVLPFVLADYNSRILDLNAPESFRDLRKPMAIQNKAREAHYINTYNDLRQARREGSSPLLSRQPHHYASLYSNSGTVLHYLVRLPPYTALFLNYQDNNFDMPDRTFHSLATTWRLITNDSPTDVKELIPEFFYLPEFLNNNEGLRLGVRQCGAGVEAVELPPWAADARLFALQHRQALEARAVRDALPHWLDLVFGHKQLGQPARDALNVFPACTYFGFSPEALPDEVSRRAAAAMVRTYGQAPRQLLRQPHPLAATDLAARAARDHRDPVIWAGLRGGRWGRYCGSPECAAPAPVATRRCADAARLLAVPPGAVLVGARGSLVVPLAQLCGGGAAGAAGAAPPALAQLSWGHSDGGVRVKRRRDGPPDLLMHVPAFDAITAASASAARGAPVVLGFRSGLVLALAAGAAPAELRAHAAAVSDVCVCAAFAVLATAGLDGRLVIWDLNTLSYVRTLPNRDGLPVARAAVSPTLCDVAAVHEAAGGAGGAGGGRCELRAHTVNGAAVGCVRGERLASVCYSGAREGVSVNCVAAGLRAGGVRLYSSWDLTPVAYVPPPHAGVAVVSIAYSADSLVLFTGHADGTVVAWESGGAAGGGSAHARILAPPAIF